MPLVLSRMPSGEPEIFASMQGEGASAGLASTFVRLAFCNLRCNWCDTAYTWDWEHYDRSEQTLEVDAGAVVEQVEALPPRNVVITGGEPLIQRSELAPLASALRVRGYRLEVETNGTVGPGPLAGLVDQWNVSPKLAHSGNLGLARAVPGVLRDFAGEPLAWLKLVVQGPADLPEVETVVAAAGFEPGRVILMPEGRTREELDARSAWLAQLCVERGYRFATRLHIYLWGDRRGV